MQIQLTGFLDKDTPVFCKELWKLCLSAQSNPQGVPKELLEAKKLELIQEKVNQHLCKSRRTSKAYELIRLTRIRLLKKHGTDERKNNGESARRTVSEIGNVVSEGAAAEEGIHGEEVVEIVIVIGEVEGALNEVHSATLDPLLAEEIPENEKLSVRPLEILMFQMIVGVHGGTRGGSHLSQHLDRQLRTGQDLARVLRHADVVPPLQGLALHRPDVETDLQRGVATLTGAGVAGAEVEVLTVILVGGRQLILMHLVLVPRGPRRDAGRLQYRALHRRRQRTGDLDATVVQSPDPSQVQDQAAEHHARRILGAGLRSRQHLKVTEPGRRLQLTVLVIVTNVG